MVHRNKREVYKKGGQSIQTANVKEVSHYQPLFHELIHGEIKEYVDFFACLPFINTREISGADASKLLLNLCPSVGFAWNIYIYSHFKFHHLSENEV